MSLPAPLIHIGYMKTGSTWLQRHVIVGGEAGLMEVATREALTDLLVKPSVLTYDPAAIQAHIAERVRVCEELSLVPAVSHERLSGNPISGGHDSTAIADRLAGLFPDARVAIVVREQRSLLASFYNEYVCGGGACSLQSFLDPPPGAKLPLFDFRFLEFHRLIEYYHQRFGGERVLVLPFEWFKRDKLAFCNRLIEFGGGRPFVSVPDRQERSSRAWGAIGVQRWLNFFFCRDSSNPAAPFRIPKIKKFADVVGPISPRLLDQLVQKRVTAHICESVGERYRESNRRTQEYVDFSLAELGYTV